ncbi:MAG: lmo0937 family membrane protein [Candidatus Saccharimonadales bacterium]
MLYTIISILVALWLIGLIAHIGGAFIHVLLLAAVIIFVYKLMTGRPKTV